MHFRVEGLAPDPFRHLFHRPAEEIEAAGARRFVVGSHPGLPDRIILRDVPPGETVLLLNHVSQPAPTPYRASHAIFIRENADAAYDAVDAIPEVMRRRLPSLRGFDAAGVLRDAGVVEGRDVEPAIERLFADPKVGSIHVHNARQGCFSARIERA